MKLVQRSQQSTFNGSKFERAKTCSLKDGAYRGLISELELALAHVLEAWLPRCIDQLHGGFLCDFDHRWKECGPHLKMLEYQARMTRAFSRVAAYPGFERYQSAATLGFEYLSGAGWDTKYGGWYHMLDRHGKVLEAHTKHAHSISYAIGACVAYYDLTGFQKSIDLAKSGFAWLDRNGHDSLNGGYFGFYKQEGSAIIAERDSPIPNVVKDCLGTPIGYKDSNTMTDILAALADLSRVCDDSLIQDRLKESFYIARDRMIVNPGSLHTYFNPDWTPLPDYARFGHSVHTGNVIAKAALSLNLLDDTRTLEVLKSVADMALKYGWDTSKGGIYFGGSCFGTSYIEDVPFLLDGKFWWVQAEGLSAFLRLSQIFPDDAAKYAEKFDQLWFYIKNNIIDWRHGGWCRAGRDNRPERWPRVHANLWKDASHEIHGLLECIRLLRLAAGDV